MKSSAWLKQSALVGLVSSLLAVLAASLWLRDGVADDVQTKNQQRHATLVANAITASLASSAESELQARVRVWKAGDLSIESIRVVVGRQLVASTRADDAAPRPLQREERALFDLAHQLRAAGETNRSEGVVRKKTVQLDDKGSTVTVTVPYVLDGEFEGIVQMQFLSAAHAQAPRGQAWGLALLLMMAAGVIGAMLRLAPERRFDWARGGAIVVLLVLAYVYQHNGLGQLAETLERDNGAIAKVQRAVAQQYGRMGAPPIADVAAPSAWDTDAYQRPLKLISHQGQVFAGVLEATTAPLVRFVKRAFWAIDLFGVVLLLYFLQGYAARTRAALREHASAYGYVAPAMIGMLVLVFFPFFYGIVLAFTDTTLFNESLPFRERWIGLTNFVTILGDFNLVQRTPEGLVWSYQNFYWTLMLTVIWTVSNVAMGVSIGFLLALALNTDGLRGKGIYRVILILPWAIPNYITALVWRGMFHPQFGVVNQFLQMFGFEPVAWFDGVFSAFITIWATNSWLSFPFMMVVILGALQSIPKDMYEAAEVEGASRWQQFRSITLPLLRPTLVPAVVLSVVWTFNMFNIPFLVAGGEPAGANEILITRAYKIAFEQYQYAYAAAYSTVIFIILLAYGYFQTRVTRATESY